MLGQIGYVYYGLFEVVKLYQVSLV